MKVFLWLILSAFLSAGIGFVTIVLFAKLDLYIWKNNRKLYEAIRVPLVLAMVLIATLLIIGSLYLLGGIYVKWGF